MEVIDEIYPTTPEQLAALSEPGPDQPIVMVNLLKFKERAEYADGSDRGLTGREAYLEYSRVVAEMIEEYRGRVLFAGDVTFLTIGHVERMWDEVVLVEYPDRAALIEMTTSDGWRSVAHHREAGLAGQLNIETTHLSGLPSAATARN